jgi:hypothetical protein
MTATDGAGDGIRSRRSRHKPFPKNRLIAS